jgi:hypothetical protein
LESKASHVAAVGCHIGSQHAIAYIQRQQYINTRTYILLNFIWLPRIGNSHTTQRKSKKEQQKLGSFFSAGIRRHQAVYRCAVPMRFTALRRHNWYSRNRPTKSGTAASSKNACGYENWIVTKKDCVASKTKLQLAYCLPCIKPNCPQHTF